MDKLKAVFWHLGAALLLANGGVFTAKAFYGVKITDMVKMKTLYIAPPDWTFWACAAVFLLFLLVKTAGKDKLFAALPLALTIPMQFFPVGIFGLALYIMSLGWTVSRYAALEHRAHPRALKSGTLWTLLAAALLAAMMFQGFSASWQAWRTGYLTMTDWGTYAETCLNTFRGDFMMSDWPVRSFSAGHLMPAFFILFAPVFGFFPYVQTAFALNVILLFGSAALFYWLVRRATLPAWQAGMLSVIYLLNPSISNMNLCIFYGFNALYLFIPFFLLFCHCYAGKYHKCAIVLFVLLLLTKETVGVFFLGLGVVMLFRKKWKPGICFMIAGGGFFLLASSFIIPYFAGNGYIFYGQYGNLGSSLTDILHSPFARPGEFWGQMLRPKNFLYIFLLLLFVFPAGWGRPYLWLAGAGLVLFNFIRGSSDIVNICQQYQTENVIWLLVVAAVCVQNPPPIFMKILCWPCRNISREHARGVLLAGTLVCAGFSHWFFAQSYYGVYNLKYFISQSSVRPLIEEAYKVIPPGVEMLSNEHGAAQFALRNRIHRYNSGMAANYVFYNLGDGFENMAPFHDKMLKNPAYGAVWVRSDERRTFFIWKKGAETRKVNLPVVSDKEWENYGFAPQHPEAFAVSCRVSPVMENKRAKGLKFFFRLKREVKGFPMLTFAIADSRSGKTQQWCGPFAFGVLSPEEMKPGAVFEVTVKPDMDFDMLSFFCKELSLSKNHMEGEVP